MSSTQTKEPWSPKVLKRIEHYPFLYNLYKMKIDILIIKKFPVRSSRLFCRLGEFISTTAGEAKMSS